MIPAGPAAALLALAAQSPAAPEPPRGVNDEILGTAEEYAVAGPARVCLMQTSVEVETGETAYLDYLGIHFGAIRITGLRGTFHVRVSGIWTEPRGGQVAPDLRGRTVRRYRQEGRPKYLIYSASEDQPNEESPLVWVEGDALGRSRDLAILARIDARQGDLASCRRRFVYGLDYPEEE
jgi:hypothetical protein